MATIKSSTASIERNSFDYIRAYAQNQSTNPTVVAELEQAYALIAENLGLSGFQFIQLLENQGDSTQQAVYLAAQLNSVRPRNALLGVGSNQTTPVFISREIAA
jgi:hypothetical protein